MCREKMMWDSAGLGGLFIAAFLAATPVPFQSEIVFLGMLAAKIAAPITLIVVASVGNTLGSLVTCAIGRRLIRYENRRWFPVTPAQMTNAADWFNRWGVWVLLASWAPFGDVIVLMAGVLRTPWWLVILLVAAAKTGRYVVLAWAAGWVV
jgi:membrane protein YqaA with SNARE-associated domain